MSSEFPSEYLKDLLPDPPALGEGGKGEVIGVDFAQT
jgi:hypothetical protein